MSTRLCNSQTYPICNLLIPSLVFDGSDVCSIVSSPSKRCTPTPDGLACPIQAGADVWVADVTERVLVRHAQEHRHVDQGDHVHKSSVNHTLFQTYLNMFHKLCGPIAQQRGFIIRMVSIKDDILRS